jgi:hypothetical protein
MVLELSIWRSKTNTVKNTVLRFDMVLVSWAATPKSPVWNIVVVVHDAEFTSQDMQKYQAVINEIKK